MIPFPIFPEPTNTNPNRRTDVRVIEDWKLMVVGGGKDDGLPPLPTFQCLEGEIDGKRIATAGILDVKGDIIETNCGRYKLGKINPEYAEELGWEPDPETVLEAIKEGI